MEIGKGIEVTEDAEFVTIRFAIKGRFGPSASGKTIIVASTSGNVTLDCGVTIGVNAYVKARGE